MITLVDEQSQIVPFVHRGATGLLYGSPGRLLWEDPKPPPPPPDPPKPPPPPDGDGEVEKLRRETERLRGALAKREADESKAKARTEAAEREAAAKRGEWERLYGEEQAKGRTLAEQLKAERGKSEGYESLLKERVEAGLRGVEDAELRKAWKGALDGLDSAAQLRMLDALQATAGKSKLATARPGAAGKSRTTIDLRTLSKDTPQTRRALNELIVKELEGKVG